MPFTQQDNVPKGDKRIGFIILGLFVVIFGVFMFYDGPKPPAGTAAVYLQKDQPIDVAGTPLRLTYLERTNVTFSRLNYDRNDRDKDYTYKIRIEAPSRTSCVSTDVEVESSSTYSCEGINYTIQYRGVNGSKIYFFVSPATS